MLSITKGFFERGVKIPNTRLIPVAIEHRGTKLCYQLICDCGKTVFAYPTDLRRGKVKSCGCYGREQSLIRATKHGLSKTPEYYAAWHAFDRCNNPNNKYYKWYGARGITVEFKDVEAMMKWLLKNLPKPSIGKFLLDRKDNSGNYKAGNLRWATTRESTRNKRSNRIIEINGERKLLCEWAELSGVGQMTIGGRIRSGFPEDLWLYKGRITKALFWNREYSKKD